MFQDKYILTSMGILCAVCVWHAVVPHIDSRYGKRAGQIADIAALIILGGLYFLFHVIFFLYIYFVVRMINNQINTVVDLFIQRLFAEKGVNLEQTFNPSIPSLSCCLRSLKTQEIPALFVQVFANG